MPLSFPASFTARPSHPPRPPRARVPLASTRNHSDPIRPGFPHERIMIFGFIQLLSGVASIILATVAMAVMAWGYNIGSGIWSGAFFVASGLIGVLSSKRKDNCMIISFMVMSILTAIVSGLLIGIASTGIVMDTHQNRTEILLALEEEDVTSYEESLVQVIVVHCLILIIAIIDGICAIISAALCCRTVCCGPLLPLGLEHRFMPPGTRVQYLTGASSADQSLAQQFAFVAPTIPTQEGDIFTFRQGAYLIQPPGLMPQLCMLQPPLPEFGQVLAGPPPPYSSYDVPDTQSNPPSYPGTPLQPLSRMSVRSAPSSTHSTLSRAAPGDDTSSVTSNPPTIHTVRPIWRPAFRPSASSPRSTLSRNNQTFSSVPETEENLINNIRNSELSYSMNSSIDHSSEYHVESEPMISPQPPVDSDDDKLESQEDTEVANSNT